MMLKHWFFSVLFLALVAVSYRVSFVLYHQDVFLAYAWTEQLYALLWGLRFDVAAVLPMTLLSLIFYKLYNTVFTLKWQWFVVPWVLVMCIVQTGDALYYQDAGRHIGYEFLASQGDALSLVQHALHTGLSLIVINIILGALYIWAFVRFSAEDEEARQQSKVKQAIIFIGILLLTVVGVRGGVSGVPQSPIQVYQIGDTKLAVIATNPVYIVFSILSAKDGGLQPITLPQASMEVEQAFAELYPETTQESSAEIKPYNIIFILLESWNAAFMQSYNAQETLDVTPNFDAYRTQGITSDLTLAGGHRTTEGMFASFCSWQNPLGASLVPSQLLDFEYLCLPEILQKQGYTTSFLQGSYRDTSGTGSFAHFLGFEESLGKVELPEGKLPHNVWGLHDDDLYDILFAKSLATTEPFFFALNTNSTHDTVLPPSVEALDVHHKHKSVMHYADAAFGRFMEKFQQSKLAQNTIIVAVSDHTAQVRGSALYEYMIPMLIITPQATQRHLPFATSQRDIAPTLLDMLGLPASPNFAGKSMLSSEVFFADYFYHQQLGWIEGDDLVNIDVSSGKKQCFKWREDLLMQNPISCSALEAQAQHALIFTQKMQQDLFSGKTKQFEAHGLP